MVLDDGNGPIVITTCIANFDVKRVLIDDGSALEVLSIDALTTMGLKEDDLSPAKPFYYFANQPFKVLE